MIGWDVTALGLPESERPFEAGRFTQSIELPGRWLERGAIAASDDRLLDSPLGWAGRRVLATMWFASGDSLDPARSDALLDAARSAAAAHPLAATTGVVAVLLISALTVIMGHVHAGPGVEVDKVEPPSVRIIERSGLEF